MATSVEYIEFVCEQIKEAGTVRFKKMFGEYMVYVNEKPVLTVCDNTVFVKKLAEIEELMGQAEVGCPYEGAREHYILDMEDAAFATQVVSAVEKATPVPKPRKKRKKS